MNTVVFRTLARALTPVILGFSLYLLYRGHNAPGGGFIGALVASAAVVLQYLAKGPRGVRTVVPVGSETLIGAGLLIAMAYGIAGLVFGDAFLQGAIWRWTPPALGEIKIAGSILFDLGVFLVVVGVIVSIVTYIGEDEA